MSLDAGRVRPPGKLEDYGSSHLVSTTMAMYEAGNLSLIRHLFRSTDPQPLPTESTTPLLNSLAKLTNCKLT